MKITAGIFSLVVIISSFLWFYFEPGFEPAITTLAGIAGLLWSIPYCPFRKNREFCRKFESLKARWYAERKLEPANLEDAKMLLHKVLLFLDELRLRAETKHLSTINDLVYKVKTIQNMQIYADGGISYDKFWNDGSESIEQIHALVKKL